MFYNKNMNIKRIVILLLIVISILSFNIYNALYINPHSFKTRQESIESTKIDDILIAFISDLHYNYSLNDEDLNKISDIITNYQPDVIVFGGDLIDHLSTNPLSEEKKEKLIEFLSSLKADDGKYAVLGNHDLDNEMVKEEVINILKNSDFKVLNNEITRIYNKKGKYLNLIGLESSLLGNPDVTLLSQLSNNTYNILVSHCPDLISDIDNENIDLMLCGHSHGMQVYLPLINFFYREPGAKKYYRGQYHIDNTLLDISNGLGTTKKDIRFMADAEIVLYRF